MAEVLDTSTTLFTLEIEEGLNPEVNCGLWARIQGSDVD